MLSELFTTARVTEPATTKLHHFASGPTVEAKAGPGREGRVTSALSSNGLWGPWGIQMHLASLLYRFFSNFVFLAAVYLSLNYIEKYQNRAVLAIVILLYAGMRSVSVVRSFYFLGRIEKLETDVRRLAGMLGDGPVSQVVNKQTVTEVAQLRRDGERKSYIDLFFLAAVVILCVAKIVTD